MDIQPPEPSPLQPEWEALGVPEDDTAEPDDAGDDEGDDELGPIETGDFYPFPEGPL